MTLQIPIPSGLDEATIQKLDTAAREAVGVQLYREGKLSHGKLAEFLGIGRGQVDDLLTRHHVCDEFTIQEITQQAEKLNRYRQ